MRLRIAIAVLALFSSAAFGNDVTELPGLVRKPLALTVAAVGGGAKSLDALVVRPDSPGPFPLALISNGMPRNGADIPKERPEAYSSAAITFAQHGYAAVVVLRSGYGRSGGPFQEALGPCTDRNYLKAGAEGGADVTAAVARLRTEPWVDPGRVVLVGHSMGGFAALAAAASNPEGVVGVISFAGAVGSARPDFVCQPDRLIEADRAFGRTTHVPGLWIFGENDHFFAPDLVRHMFDAYAAGGASVSLFQAPPIGRDGHLLIFAPAETAWWPQVATFLESVHLPTRQVVPLPPPALLAAPVPLDEVGQKAFAVYVPSRSYEKAFATDAAGHYGVAFGQRTMTDAEQAAIGDCQRMWTVCSAYAVGNEIVPAAGHHPP
jgi:dienelactone hydrolase